MRNSCPGQVDRRRETRPVGFRLDVRRLGWLMSQLGGFGGVPGGHGDVHGSIRQLSRSLGAAEGGILYMGSQLRGGGSELEIFLRKNKKNKS